MGGTRGEKPTEPPQCQLLAAQHSGTRPPRPLTAWKSTKLSSIPAGHRPPALGVMDLRRPPPAPKPSGQSHGGGDGSLGLRPLSQAPAEFNSKVQSAFAPSQIKGCSAREMSWLIKDRRGALDRQAHHCSLPTPSASECSQTSAAVPARCPTRKAH